MGREERIFWGELGVLREMHGLDQGSRDVVAQDWIGRVPLWTHVPGVTLRNWFTSWGSPRHAIQPSSLPPSLRLGVCPEQLRTWLGSEFCAPPRGGRGKFSCLEKPSQTREENGGQVMQFTP